MDDETPRERDRRLAKARMRRRRKDGSTANDRAWNEATKALIHLHKRQHTLLYHRFVMEEEERDRESRTAKK